MDGGARGTWEASGEIPSIAKRDVVAWLEVVLELGRMGEWRILQVGFDGTLPKEASPEAEKIFLNPKGRCGDPTLLLGCQEGPCCVSHCSEGSCLLFGETGSSRFTKEQLEALRAMRRARRTRELCWALPSPTKGGQASWRGRSGPAGRPLWMCGLGLRFGVWVEAERRFCLDVDSQQRRWGGELVTSRPILQPLISGRKSLDGL